MENSSLVEKVKLSLTNVVENENGSFTFDSGSMYDLFLDDSDLPKIEEKLNNLMILMEEENKNGNLKSLLERDFESDIWNII